MAEEDDAQKTEQPTDRRLEEAVKKGQVVYSREVTTFLMLLAFTIIIAWVFPSLMNSGAITLGYYIENAHDIEISSESLQSLSWELLIKAFKLIIIPLLITVLVAILSSFLQTGRFIGSIDPIMPKLDRISPLAGFKRIFSLRSVFELVKGLIKISVVALVGFVILKPYFSNIMSFYDQSLVYVSAFIQFLSIKLLIGVLVVMAIVAVLDFLYQRHIYIKNLMMTKQEIKQEYRESEGSPEIKSKLKSIRMQRARRRMMANVPKSDVIITNPTHYSVALKYDPNESSAPIVTAKGQDNIALIIREIAKKHDIPLVENVELARALYKLVDIDEEIPLEHYKAVAEIISYVYKLKGKIL